MECVRTCQRLRHFSARFFFFFNLWQSNHPPALWLKEGDAARKPFTVWLKQWLLHKNKHQQHQNLAWQPVLHQVTQRLRKLIGCCVGFFCFFKKIIIFMGPFWFLLFVICSTSSSRRAGLYYSVDMCGTHLWSCPGRMESGSSTRITCKTQKNSCVSTKRHVLFSTFLY